MRVKDQVFITKGIHRWKVATVIGIHDKFLHSVFFDDQMVYYVPDCLGVISLPNMIKAAHYTAVEHG